MKREGIPTRPSSEALNLAYIMQRHGKPEARKHPNWHNGEHLGSDGYVRILAPWHPFAQCMGHVRRARLVMEDIIGRFMKPEEEIHHRNGKRWDDRPENLELMASKGQHRSQENNLQNKKEMR